MYITLLIKSIKTPVVSHEAMEEAASTRPDWTRDSLHVRKGDQVTSQSCL